MFWEDPDAKVIPCDQQFTSKSQMREQIQNLFQDGVKELNFVASCECGHLEGNFYEGMVCNRCHQPVRTYFADKVKFRAWLELPPFAPSIIHPTIYRVLDKWLGKCKSVSIMESLLNVDVELPPPLKGLVGQGFEYFYNNFDDIIRFFLNEYAPLKQPSARARSEGIAEYISKYRDRIFIRLNKELCRASASGDQDEIRAAKDAFRKMKNEFKECEKRIHPNICSFGHLDSVDSGAKGYDMFINNMIPEILARVDMRRIPL